MVASTSETAKEFLKTHEPTFSNLPMIGAVDYLTYGLQDFSFAPYGSYWKFMKKLCNVCMSELLGGWRLELLLPGRSEEIKWFIKWMLKKAKASEEVDLGRELIRMINNVVSRMMMGKSCTDKEEEADDVRKLIHETVELRGKFKPFCKNLDLQGFKKQLKEARDRFDSMVEKIIEGHKSERRKIKESGGSGEVKDLLDISLDVAEDESSEM